MTRLSLLFCLPLLAAGAEPPAPPTPEPRPPAGESCGAEALQGLVGQSARVLETMRFGTTTRILRPGMAVTMDYSPTRLNISIDEHERIRRVTCG